MEKMNYAFPAAFDNVLYVLAIIAWILYNIFGKKKKKKPIDESENQEQYPHRYPSSEKPSGSESPKREPEPAKDIFKEIITAMGGDYPVLTEEKEEPPVIKPEKIYRPQQVKSTIKKRVEQPLTLENTESLEKIGVPDSFSPAFSYENTPSGKPGISEDKNSRMAVSPDIHYAQTEETTPADGTDWKQAVIYSEIVGKPRSLNSYDYLF